jgi:hypothetical protein
MDKKQILNILAKEAAQAAKDQATATLAALSADDLRPLVAEQLKTITTPLQAEIETTQSVWVKIRNRIYLRVINSAIDNIIQTIQDGLTELSKK